MGKTIKATPSKNCSTCAFNDGESCTYEGISPRYCCSEWADALLSSDVPSNNVYTFIESLKKEKSVILTDTKVDDSDFKPCPNYFTWLTSDKYLGTTPYAKQVQLGTHLFSDYCPSCSDMEYVNDIPYKENISNIPNKIAFLEHGVCTHCNWNRAKGHNSDEYPCMEDLVAVIGQRCITGDTLLLTSNGLTRISDWVPKKTKSGWYNDLKLRGNSVTQIAGRCDRICPVIETGHIVYSTKLWVSEPEQIINVRLYSGLEIKGKKEHPIMTDRGWVKLKDLYLDTIIPVYYGHNIWGRSKLLTKDLARLLGFWVSEGTGGVRKIIHITNYDKNILDLCYKEILQLQPKAKISYLFDKIRNNGEASSILSADKKLYTIFNNLIDGQSRKSNKKHIPRSILESPEHIITAFLQALFEGDGGLERESRIVYCSMSNTLVQQIQIVLNNLGILSKIFKKKAWATNGSKNQTKKISWHIEIAGPAVEIFQSKINFFSNRKKKELQNAINNINLRKKYMPYWYQKYPSSVKEEFIELIKRIDIEWYNIWPQRQKGEFASRGHVNFRGEIVDWRRLLDNNICLTINSLEEYSRRLQENSYWYILSKELRTKLLSFFDHYLRPNCYWSTITDIKFSKNKYITYDIQVPGYNRFIANGLLNHNSGKSVAAAQILSYSTHQYLMLRNPSQYFGLLSNTILSGVIVAVTYSQAKDSIFDPFMELITSAPWFNQYHDFLKEKGNKLGEELYFAKDTYLYYNHRKLTVNPASPNIRSLRGRTRFVGNLDEAGYFDTQTGSIRLDGIEISGAITRSLQSVRSACNRLLARGVPNVPPAPNLSIGSPRRYDDTLMTLYSTGKTNPRQYSLHLPTWKFNPTITRKDLDPEFNRNRITAMRDFGAVPPLSESPFFDKISAFSPVCIGNKNAIEPEPITIKNAITGRTFSSIKLHWKWTDKSVCKILSLDAGSVSNSYGVMVGHRDELERTVVDLLFEVWPQPNYQVSFSHLEGVLEEICTKMNVIVLTSDRWQNLKMAQDIEEKLGITDIPIRLTYSDFLLFRDAIYTNQFILPRIDYHPIKIMDLPEVERRLTFIKNPVCRFIRQCVDVQDSGSEICKGSMTDDLFRVGVLLHSAFNNEKIKELVKLGNVRDGGGIISRPLLQGRSNLLEGITALPSESFAQMSKQSQLPGSTGVIVSTRDTRYGK